MSLIKFFFYFSLALLLTACGFHLRGQAALPVQLKQLAFESDAPYSLLSTQLQQTLANMGVTLTDKAAPITLKLSKDDFSQTTATSGATNQLTTYAISYTVSYQLLNAAGKPLIEPRSITINRSFTANNNQMLGSSNEQTLLQQDMRREAIMQIINQLNSQSVKRAIASA